LVWSRRRRGPATGASTVMKFAKNEGQKAVKIHLEPVHGITFISKEKAAKKAAKKKAKIN
jgi:hypothetical protein